MLEDPVVVRVQVEVVGGVRYGVREVPDDIGVVPARAGPAVLVVDRIRECDADDDGHHDHGG